MTRKGQYCILALAFSLAAASSAIADGPTFTSIDFPGATSTSAWGINARGDIVGGYLSPDKSDHGFLLSGGQFTTIDFLGCERHGSFYHQPTRRHRRLLHFGRHKPWFSAERGSIHYNRLPRLIKRRSWRHQCPRRHLGRLYFGGRASWISAK